MQKKIPGLKNVHADMIFLQVFGHNPMLTKSWPDDVIEWKYRDN